MTNVWSARAEAYRESDAHREGRDLELFAEWAEGSTALDVATGGGHVARALRLDPRRVHHQPLAELGAALVELHLHRDAALAVDPERLQLVLTNLLANAIRDSPAGGRVRLSADAAGSIVRIVVADEGQGIDPEYAGYVFERFYRVPGSLPGGVGLGLSIAREIVSAHGGEIGVETAAGTGCRFWFTLPRASAAVVHPS